MEIKAYEVGTKEYGYNGHVINTTSRGKAKSKFYHHLEYDFPYTSIRCRCKGKPYTSEQFKRNAEYRNIPFAYCGMAVKVGDRPGWIVGHNGSANLNIMFEDGRVLNCHPNWDITYYDSEGNEIVRYPGHGDTSRANHGSKQWGAG